MPPPLSLARERDHDTSTSTSSYSPIPHLDSSKTVIVSSVGSENAAQNHHEHLEEEFDEADEADEDIEILVASTGYEYDPLSNPLSEGSENLNLTNGSSENLGGMGSENTGDMVGSESSEDSEGSEIDQNDYLRMSDGPLFSEMTAQQAERWLPIYVERVSKKLIKTIQKRYPHAQLS